MVRGSSIETAITTRGSDAGRNPTNEAMYRRTYRPSTSFRAVPVFPATWYPGICAAPPVPVSTTDASIRVSIVAVSSESTRRDCGAGGFVEPPVGSEVPRTSRGCTHIPPFATVP